MIGVKFCFKQTKIRHCKELTVDKTQTSFNRFIVLGSTTCQTRCQISLNYNSGHLNELVVVSFLFDGYNLSRETGCSTANRAQLFIDCSNLRKSKY